MSPRHNHGFANGMDLAQYEGQSLNNTQKVNRGAIKTI